MKVLCGASLTLALAMTAYAADDPKTPDAKPSDIKTSPYYPMQDGSSWNYKAGDSKFTLKAVKHEKVGTTMCARIETVQEGKVVGSEDVFVKDDGVYRLASDDKVIDPPVMILKLTGPKSEPPKNDAWNVESHADTSTGKETLKGTFAESDGVEVTVPAGKYTTVMVACDDLDANGAKYSFKTYYAKDVGMVKQEIEAGGLKVAIELDKYEAAPK